MAFLANLGLYFVLFLPLTLALGALTGLYVGPATGATQVEALAASGPSFPIFVWFNILFPRLVPLLLLVPVVHFAHRTSARRGYGRWPSSALTLGLFLGLFVGLFGTELANAAVLFLVGLPAAVYGALLRAPRRRDQGEDSSG